MGMYFAQGGSDAGEVGQKIQRNILSIRNASAKQWASCAASRLYLTLRCITEHWNAHSLDSSWVGECVLR